ncbi:hypothetical protein F441_00594, partial [Phytophthora nicotianae CJ01A1]
DAESRMSRLLANLYSTVDGVNMESIIHEDPKRVVDIWLMPYVQRPFVLPSKTVWSALLVSCLLPFSVLLPEQSVICATKPGAGNTSPFDENGLTRLGNAMS